MNIGYASKTVGIRGTKIRSITLKNASEKNLIEVISHNLSSLDKIIDYNIENKINFFRISSDIIPLATRPEMTVKWWDIFKDQFESIGAKIKDAKMRVTMHPGQYTVLNSLSESVVKSSVEELEYHQLFLELLNTDASSKIILHIGGVYGDKEAAVARFIENYNKLSQKVKDRLIIENYDKSYNIEDVLNIAYKAKIPVVYDNLHNEILSANTTMTDNDWIKLASKTWQKKDGRQKVHYSQQAKDKKIGTHSQTIYLKPFLAYYKSLDLDVDIMLEVKDKNLSTNKINNAINNQEIKILEREWSKYKYSVLEKSPQNYKAIRQLLKDKKTYPVLDFYNLIEESLDVSEDIGSSVNALDHVWGYFKNEASDKELEKYLSLRLDYKNKNKRLQLVKNHLEKMALKYKKDYLLSGYYFDI